MSFVFSSYFSVNFATLDFSSMKHDQIRSMWNLKCSKTIPLFKFYWNFIISSFLFYLKREHIIMLFRFVMAGSWKTLMRIHMNHEATLSYCLVGLIDNHACAFIGTCINPKHDRFSLIYLFKTLWILYYVQTSSESCSHIDTFVLTPCYIIISESSGIEIQIKYHGRVCALWMLQ